MFALSPDVMTLIIAVLAMGSIGGLVAAVLYGRFGQNSERDRRLAAIAAMGAPMSQRGGIDDAARRKIIEDTLKNLAEKQKVKNGGRPSLMGRLNQAGLTWTPRRYYVTCVVSALAGFVLAAAVLRIGWLFSLSIGILCGLLLPHLYVSHTRKRRLNGFAAEFPNSVDVIVRGVKAGLPLADCLKIISTEAQEPVRGEFRRILEDQTLGVPIYQAIQRLPERIPLAEANFFAIVISLQSSVGGSLAETLGNLSKILRERKKMKSKITAMSAEANYSALIIGSLPFVIGCIIFVTSPKYIALLFTNTTGNIVLGIAAIWMGIGIFVMRKMISFDF
ncbi:type II secretion system F family protein [Roseixanthobacter liquoris]|uniref:type II secretion system F family protein n=1 Tax=Roseixanthobacter liquoris TaxID=3119921 RepID=UPI003729FE19